MADWAREFSKYPKAQQLHMVPPVQLSGPGPISFSFGLAQSELPRLLLRSENGERTVQLQADRFGFGWARNVPIRKTTEYPGFEKSSSVWPRNLRKFRAWCAQRPGQLPREGLLSGYHNRTPFVVGGKRRQLWDIFRWVQRNRPVSGFQVSWSELLETNRPDAPRVSAVVAVGSVPPVTEALISTSQALPQSTKTKTLTCRRRLTGSISAF